MSTSLKAQNLKKVFYPQKRTSSSTVTASKHDKYFKNKFS